MFNAGVAEVVVHEVNLTSVQAAVEGALTLMLCIALLLSVLQNP